MPIAAPVSAASLVAAGRVGGERIERRVVYPGMLEWRELPILDPLVVDQGETAASGVMRASRTMSSGVPPKPARSSRWRARAWFQSATPIGARSSSQASGGTATWRGGSAAGFAAAEASVATPPVDVGAMVRSFLRNLCRMPSCKN